MFIAVHAGCGTHTAAQAKAHRSACERACRFAVQAMRAGQPAVDAVTLAVACLEVGSLQCVQHVRHACTGLQDSEMVVVCGVLCLLLLPFANMDPQEACYYLIWPPPHTRTPSLL